MGAFLSLLKPKANQETLPDLNINLEDSVPTPDERAFYEQIQNSTSSLDELLLLMRNYKGCSQLIRKAISEPTEENEIACWEALQKPVHTIIKLYEICQTLEEKVPEVFDYLCSGTIPVHNNMKRNPSIAQFIVRFFNFASEFDNLKVATPDFQNDFSYYRRLLSKFHMNSNTQLQNVTSIISDDQANRLSMFFAYPNPAIKTVINSVVKFANQTKPALKQNVLDFLLGIVGTTYYAITKDRIKHAVTLDAMFYTMITCTIIYDHVHPFGVFNKPSEIDIKLILKSIDAHAGPLKPKLLSSLQYNSLHLNDPTTPQNIKSLIKA